MHSKRSFRRFVINEVKFNQKCTAEGQTEAYKHTNTPREKETDRQRVNSSQTQTLMITNRCLTVVNSAKIRISCFTD